MAMPPSRSNDSSETSGLPASMQAWKHTDRETVEDVLRAMLECEYHQQTASDERLAGLTGASREAVLHALARAREAGLVATGDNAAATRPTPAGSGGRGLLPAGREIALLIMRAHRLVETRLARESGLQPERWHELAHTAEHRLSRDEVNRLADRLDNPRFDPHGDPIPTREGHWPGAGGRPLLSWTPETRGVIDHVEDEPPALFARLARAGVYAGMRFTLHDIHPAGCRLTIEARKFDLPLELAAMVRVRPPLDSEKPVPAGACRLSDIGPGGSADVLLLLPGCIGAERSRLLDLGFVPGSRIEYALQSPFQGPAAFRVRGTLVALRREQADQVLVAAEPKPAPGNADALKG
ncbi:iron dependent repressor [Opitutaceae bacterium TAV5]|nr:iron dependent repressor [Opitutaceae bacterium TAV5]